MRIKTTGIILKHRNIGENDRILTILTAEFGLIEATARSSKSLRSPLTGATQILSYTELCLFKGKRSYYIVDSAEPIEQFYNLRIDVVKLSLADYFSELCVYLSPTIDNAGELIRLLLNTLYFLQKGEREEELLKSVFELRALSIAGFMPNLVHCPLCGEYQKEHMYFLPLEGLFICKDCFFQSEYNHDGLIRFPLYPPVLKAMRHIVFSEQNRVFSFRLGGDFLKQLSFIIEKYTILHTEGRFKSLEVYKSLTETI